MKKRQLTQIVRLCAGALCLWSVRATAESAALKGSSPNIILVMTDDQGYGDLGCHGHPYLKTPNLDRLYAQSTRFTDFHVSPTCAPTRAALMSGRAPFKNGVTHTILERDRMTLKATTIAQVLKTAGYATGIFGKWHLGDEDPYQPHNRGFDETFIHGAGGIGQNFPGAQGDAPGTSYFDPIIKHNNRFVKTDGYCTDVFFKQTLAWIEERKDSGKPFFAYLPTNAPHGPFHVEQRYKDVYKDKCADQTAAFFGMIANIDENMGVLMQKLDAWELTDNTLLIFMTDNGSAKGSRIYNAGMKGGKGSPHEGGSRVPLFMRWPGKLKPGLVVDRLARHIDLFPTLAGIAGAPIPEGLELDGRSLLPLIRDPQAPWTDRNLFFHTGRWKKKGAPGRWGKGNTDPDQAKYKGFAVRNEKWRLVGNALYDIEQDPAQTKDVAQEHPKVASEMLKAFDTWWDEVRPLMVNEDAPLDTGKPFIEQFEKQRRATGIPGMKAKTAKPSAEGVICLLAANAELVGRTLFFNRKRNDIGRWTNPNDRLEWKIVGAQKGTYAVTFTYGSPDPSNTYVISAGSASLQGKTENTGAFDKHTPFALGTLDLLGGDVLLSIKAGPGMKGALMNFKELRLEPK
ncbi:MAG: arylsulfatase [Lentisphaerae bacterium]|nr:arylsulfatase [Lentisphaerota bacterium]MBT4823425.1 arylsulfatase [Lentisphaerota bacterium]MBT7060417.1 arylsulfatase [Lentisphaerota bacterium]MBT7844729.1 arylsulfatase [Lentisphaerota bacterium]